MCSLATLHRSCFAFFMVTRSRFCSFFLCSLFGSCFACISFAAFFLPRNSSRQLFRFLHGHRQPFCSFFLCSLFRSCFACISFAAFFLPRNSSRTAVSLSSWSLAAVLQLFSLQPFPQLLSTLRYFICSFLPRDPSPQLFCFLPGHRKPFCSFFLLWQLFFHVVHDIT